MISPEEMKSVSARVDNGYLLLVILAAMISAALIMAWRSERFRRGAARLARFDVATLPLFQNIALPHLLILAVIVRIPRLFDSFWYDEAFTARIVSLPLERIPAALMQDVHPPLSYAIQWVFAQIFGVNEIALRLPALLLGVLLVWMTHRIARHLSLNRSYALTAAGLIAVMPAAIYYSNEARAYMLMAVLAFGMVIAILENRPALFAGCAAAICWSHNLGFFYAPVMSITALIYWSAARRWMLWLIPAALVAAVWLPFLLQQTGLVSDGYWTHQLTLGGVLWVWTDMLIMRQIMEVFALPVFVTVITLTLFAVTFTFRRVAWDKRWTAIVNIDRFCLSRWFPLMALMIGVPLLVALVSALWYPIYLHRALLPCGLALVFFWAYALTHAPWRQIARVALIPVAVMVAVSMYNPTIGRAHMREMAQSCDGSDYVYATSIPAAMFASYYVTAPLRTWSDAGDLGYTLTPESKTEFGFINAETATLAGVVCVMSLDTPTTSAAERAHIEALTAQYGGSETTFEINQYYHVRFVRLEVG